MNAAGRMEEGFALWKSHRIFCCFLFDQNIQETGSLSMQPSGRKRVFPGMRMVSVSRREEGGIMSGAVNSLNGTGFEKVWPKTERKRTAASGTPKSGETAVSWSDLLARTSDSYVQSVTEREAGNNGNQQSGCKEKKESRSAASVNLDASTDLFRLGSEDGTQKIPEESSGTQENRQFTAMICKTLGYQANTYASANATPMVDGSGIWHFMTSGNYVVDLSTRDSAQQALDEDGNFGVRRTSERLFSFASSLSGNDPAKMHSLEESIESGFAEAEQTFGQKLPSVCSDTVSAVRQLFDQYFAGSNA